MKEILIPSGIAFASLKVEESPSYLAGVRIVVTFENGYGASIINNSMTNGGVELAVLGRDGDLCYSTPITSDVIGHLTPEELHSTLVAISNL